MASLKDGVHITYKPQNQIHAELDAVPFEEARDKVLAHHYGHPDSAGDKRAQSWLAIQEAKREDAREADSMEMARVAGRRAWWAICISLFAIIVSLFK